VQPTVTTFLVHSDTGIELDRTLKGMCNETFTACKEINLIIYLDPH